MTYVGIAMTNTKHYKRQKNNDEYKTLKTTKMTNTNVTNKDGKYLFENAASRAPVPQWRAVPRPP